MAEQLSQFFFFDGEHLSDMSKELFEKKKVIILEMPCGG